MPPRDRDGAPADDHPRPGGELAPYALAEGESHLTLGAVLAQRGHARVKKRAGILGRLEEQDVVVFLGDVVAQRAIARRDEMRVRVHQAGEDRAPGIVSSVHRSVVGHADIGLVTKTDDPIALHEQRGMLGGRDAGSIEETGGRDQREANGCLSHAVASLQTAGGETPRPP